MPRSLTNPWQHPLTGLLVACAAMGQSGAAELVPEDKQLDPAWVASLTARGEPTVLRGRELDWVGMPVGGQFAGQVYLGGDGTLWLWDIFNQFRFTGVDTYAKPVKPSQPFPQGFTVAVGGRTWTLDRNGCAEVAFRGTYPIGTVDYRDPALPLQVRLEAFSPFIPLNSQDSAFPAVLLRFTATNPTPAPVTAVLGGHLDNPVLLHHADDFVGVRRNRPIDGPGFAGVECSAQETEVRPMRPELVFEDWSRTDYTGWTVAGTAFGSGPIRKTALPKYQGDVGGDTPALVNSHALAPGANPDVRDQAVGTLTSRPFLLERRQICCWIGGGRNPGQTCVNVLVDGQVVRSITGPGGNRMEQAAIDVAPWLGKTATLQIVDARTAGWGHIGVGRIWFRDRDPALATFAGLSDQGTLALALIDGAADPRAAEATAPLDGRITAAVQRTLTIPPGGSAQATFAIAWHFPNLGHLPLKTPQGRYYATRFASATAVVDHLARHRERLIGDTFAWRDTWYDSTLPHWFLDRTLLNIGNLATSTWHRLADGRQWAWEGTGNCAGTCGHVYYYGQAVARLFPDLEREQRERVDFAGAMRADGAIRFRAENSGGTAVDAQAGYLLRALREHQMSRDPAFLRRIYPAVRKATQWLIGLDGNGDGLIEGAQHNTLDTAWYGASAWLSGLYQAGLQAAATMADEMADPDFAGTCHGIARKGQAKLVAELYNGEYFQNRVDPDHLDQVNSGSGCFIDQVLGQSWAFQVGLPRIFPAAETRSALRALWRHNYTPDVGPYRAVHKPGRWYAMPGEAGLLMCTFPRPDWDLTKATGVGKGAWSAMYLNECMNGFEHQVAGHMLWEGLVQEGLAIERTIHDRYGAAKRNPWNEIECGEHYGRSLASYGVFLAACGYAVHGPRGHLAFDPRLSPEEFRAAFTAPAGWGTYAQRRSPERMQAELKVVWGQVDLKTLGLRPARLPATATARRGTATWPLAITPRDDGQVDLAFPEPCTVTAGQTLTVELR